jgi:hypothetical protein
MRDAGPPEGTLAPGLPSWPRMFTASEPGFEGSRALTVVLTTGAPRQRGALFLFSPTCPPARVPGGIARLANVIATGPGLDPGGFVTENNFVPSTL